MSLVNACEKYYFSSNESVFISDCYKQCSWVANKQENRLWQVRAGLDFYCFWEVSVLHVFFQLGCGCFPHYLG